MPSWLRGFATYQPVSQVASAARGLMIGWPTIHPRQALWAAGISLVIVLVMAPLSIRKFRRVL